MRLAFLTCGFHPQHPKSNTKEASSLCVLIVCLFLRILMYNSCTQGNREHSRTQPQPVSQNNCWDHAPSTFLGNALLLPRALHHPHCLGHQHCGREFSSLSFQTQGAMMYVEHRGSTGCLVTTTHPTGGLCGLHRRAK